MLRYQLRRTTLRALAGMPCSGYWRGAVHSELPRRYLGHTLPPRLAIQRLVIDDQEIWMGSTGSLEQMKVFSG